MVNVLRFKFVYIDVSVLKDPYMTYLATFFAEKHIGIRLYLHDVWEYENVKHLKIMEYICDIVYGNQLIPSVKTDVNIRHLSLRNICVIASQSLANEAIHGISIGDSQTYTSIEMFIKAKQRYDKILMLRLIFIIVIGILYFIGYFYFLNQLPEWMNDGVVAFLMCLFPAVIMIVSFVYGCSRGLFRYSTLFELLLD